MAVNINMRGVQETVEDGAKKVNEVGRKALLAYLGVWGMGWDASKAVYKDMPAWVDKAEKRGEVVEKDLMEVFHAYQKDFPGEVTKLAEKVQSTVSEVAKEVGPAADRYYKNLEKYVASVRKNVAPEAVVEIKVKAEAGAKKAKAVVAEAAEPVTEAVESAVDALWKGYDSLSVKDILAGLDGKSFKDLEALREYEVGSKNRVTVLREIDARMQAMTS
jgi:hypothetical protein